jgi:hypothetical protein
MSLINIFRNKPKIEGTIAYFSLTEWWLSAFSEVERKYVEKKFQPFGGAKESLTKGDVSFRSDSAVGFLHNLAGWFGKDEDRYLANRILEKAEELIYHSGNPLDIHFFYQSKIEIFYKDRDKMGGLEKAVFACRQQIGYAPKASKAFKKEYKGGCLPSHRGYKQLAIILEKQKNFSEVIEVCTQAMEQGWLGDWKKRIERCKKKVKK